MSRDSRDNVSHKLISNLLPTHNNQDWYHFTKKWCLKFVKKQSSWKTKSYQTRQKFSFKLFNLACTTYSFILFTFLYSNIGWLLTNPSLSKVKFWIRVRDVILGCLLLCSLPHPCPEDNYTLYVWSLSSLLGLFAELVLQTGCMTIKDMLLLHIG